MDILASEYGWTKDYIWFSVYPEDLVVLQDMIRMRELDDIITRLRISTNPHLEPSEAKEFAESLMRKRRQMEGVQEDQIDRAGLKRLKNQLKKESKTIKVK